MKKSNQISFLQSNDIQFEHVTAEKGLSQHYITNIYQNNQGYIWIGTLTVGLYRFDGIKFKVFKHNNVNPTSLSSNSIRPICEDKSGILWIGTREGGLNKFIREKEQFVHYKHNPEDPTSLSGNNVYSIYEDKSGILWIGTGSGLNKFDKEKEQFVHYKHNPEDPTSLSRNTVWSICEDKSGILWIGNDKGGLNKFDREKEQFTHYKHTSDDPTSIGKGSIQSIYEDKSGILWIGTAGGLNKFDKEKEQFTHYIHNPEDPLSINDSRITSIYEDKSGILWIGTAGGLNKFDKEKEQFTHYIHNPEDPLSINDSRITSIYEDKSGILWIGTAKGLSKFDNRRQQFIHYSINISNSKSIINNNIMSLYEDNLKDLWAGTHLGGLIIFKEKGEKFIHFKYDPDNPTSISNNNVYSIYEDNAGIMWIGTAGGGLNKFCKEKKQFFHYMHNHDDPSTLSDNIIMIIHEDKSGDIWIGTFSGGLNKFDKKSGKFIKYSHSSNDSASLSDNCVISIHEDKQGILWIGTSEGGLNILKNERNQFQHYKHEPNNPTSLSNNHVNTIYEDSSGVIWIGTSEGLNRFDKEKEEFTHFNENDGLANDDIVGLLEDNNGNLWLSTQKGLSKFNLKTEIFINYDMKDGLQNDYYNYGAYHKGKEGKMFFGGINGITVFHPDNIKDNLHIPPVVITDFKLLHKSVPVGFDKSTNRTILEKSITETKEIELNYEDNVITFEFVALDFQCPEKSLYAYMMEGFDKDWIHTDASRCYATYTNLDPGEYTFRVKGSNNDGIWNEEGTSLKIKIMPEMRSRFFADISHEFRTPLTLILGPLKQIIEETKESKTLEEASLAEKSAERLNVLVDQLLDLSRVVTGNLKLQTCAENIVPFLKGLTLSFASLAERKNIILKFICKRKILRVYVDRDKVEKIVTNILSNAFKFTEEEGKIDVNVQSTDGKAEIRISDTGIGIPKKRLDKIFDRFYQVGDTHKRRGEGAGIGLALTKELVELHKGEIKVESEEGKGTTFIVSLLLGRDHLLPEEISEGKIEKDEEPTPIIAEVEEEKKEEEIDIDLITETEKPLLLIVEDNSDVRTYIRGHLEESYRISEAVDGKDGMNKALKHIPDLIVSDVMMPEMNGFELCEELKKDERTSHIPVILLTAKADSEDKIEGLETGADDYIMKPFDAKELQVRIKNLIEQRKKLRERFSQEATIPIKKGKYSQIDEQFLKKAMDAIEKHISEPEFHLDDFGKEIGMSRLQLHRKVRALTDHSPHHLIRFIRLKHAAESLSKGAGNITEIAYDFGFSNPSHFAKTFKEQFGKSPSDYIKTEKQ